MTTTVAEYEKPPEGEKISFFGWSLTPVQRVDAHKRNAELKVNPVAAGKRKDERKKMWRSLSGQ